MSDLTNKIINLIKEGHTANEISKELNLSNKQIFNILNTIKSKGINYKRKYYSNGEIMYLENNTFDSINREKTLITDINETKVTFMGISDTHIGSVYERIDLLNKVYEYCVLNNIHLVINCGDLIDGITFGAEKKYNEPMKQIDYFLKVYPFDKSILTFALLGNHDADTYINFGINFEDVINSYRHDIVSLGYQDGALIIKNDKIFFNHPIDNTILKNYTKINSEYIGKKLVFAGHSHYMSLKEMNDRDRLVIPALWTTKTNPYTVLKIVIKFDPYGNITNCEYEQLLLPDFAHLSTSNIRLVEGKKLYKRLIENEENYETRFNR